MMSRPHQSVPNRSRHGFTLIEMSVVLLIIGLIVGGIFAGQELYRLSQINSIVVDLTRLRTAIDGFKLKYRAVPGDMADATHYFGTASGGCPNGTGTGTQTCNGNGDGYIGNAGSVTTANGEALRFWQQLAAGGFIANPPSGYYTGVSGPNVGGGYGDHVVGANCLASRIKNVGYAMFYTPYIGITDNHPWLYAGVYNNNILVGGQLPGYEPALAAFTPSEGASIDRKFDDGLPGMGRLVTRNAMPGADVNCTNGTTATSATAAYNTTFTNKACILYLRRATE